ncbi:MAG: EAL domain-containing protein [Rhodoblastus sp.]|nr:EAL domain-containing protein [Rhodoblastus sp.]
MRWDRPGVGIVGPGAFLPQAEENGLIIQINEWVLRKACADAKIVAAQWLSGVSRCSEHVADPVPQEERAAAGRPRPVRHRPGSAPARAGTHRKHRHARDIDAVANDLRELNRGRLDRHRRFRHRLFVAQLHRSTGQRIKIDQTFVRNMTQDPNDSAIVRAIITLGRSLGLEVVAEGVETSKHLQGLRDVGCEIVQGYLLGRPGAVRGAFRPAFPKWRGV